MTLLGHLIAGDIRRHRWLLALWVITVIAATAVDGLLPVVAERRTAGNTAALLDGLLWCIRVLLRIVVIAQVVHTHPLVGSDAFWLTRPIPPMLLLRAKAILLTATLVAVPVAAEVALMTIYGVPASQMLGAALDTALFTSFYVALLATAAALTPTFTRFLLLCGSLLAALALLAAVGATIATIAPPDEYTVRQPPGPPDPTPGIVVVLLLVAGSAATLASQYRHRQIPRSAAIALGSAIAAFVVADLFPWPLLQTRVELPPWARDSLAIEAHAEAVRAHAQSTTGIETEWRRAQAPMRVNGLQPGWSAGTGLLQATLQLDGETLSSAADASPAPAVAGSDDTLARDEAIRGILGASRVVTGNPPMPHDSSLLLVRDAVFRRHESARGQYRGRFHVQLTHHRVEATVPLQTGTAAASGSYRFTISAITLASGRVQVRLQDSNATSSFDRRPYVDRTYYLVNRRTREAFEARPSADYFGIAPRIFNVSIDGSESGFQARNVALRFPPDWKAGGDVIDEAWAREADLVVVGSTAEGTVERTLDIAGFPLDK